VLRAPTAVPTCKIAPAPVTLRAATIGDDRTGARPRHRRRHLSYWAGRKRLDRPPRLEEARLASSRALGCPILALRRTRAAMAFPSGVGLRGPAVRRWIGESTNGLPFGPAVPKSRPPEKIQKQKKNVLASGLSKKSIGK